MPYNEAKFQVEFKRFLKQQQEHLPITPEFRFWHETMALEYKALKHKKRLNWKKHLQPQQIPKLYQAKHQCLYKKLSDLDPSLKPFDAFQICFAKAYLVVCWFTPYKKKDIYLLDVDRVIQEMEKTKSLTQERAKQISDKYIMW